MRLIDRVKAAFTTKKPAPVKAHWQSGKSTNRAFRDWGNPGPNLANLSYLNTARARARDAVRNAPFAARIIDLQVTNIVGTGIVPRFNDKTLADLWTKFEDECDADWSRDIYGMQESAVRAWQEAGECFIRIRPRRVEDGLAVPFQLEILEADMVPLHDYKLANGNEIIQGVEFNRIGKRVAYYFHKRHPADGYSRGVSITELVRVPVEFVIHLYEPLRPGQIRGFPPLATALQRIQQMNDFDEATIERQKLASSITFAITRPAPDSAGVDPLTGEAIDPLRSESEVKAGSAYTMLPGEEITGMPLPSLGGEYEAFSKVQIRAVSAGAGVPYELVNNDFSGLSDRTARVLLNEYRRRVEQNQWNRVVRQMMRPVVLYFIESAILSSAAPSGVDRGVRHVPPAWPYFHPVQDVESIREEIKLGLRSRSDAIHSRGNDPDQVLRERAEDQQAEKGAGLYSTGIVESPEEAKAQARALNQAMVKAAEAETNTKLAQARAFIAEADSSQAQTESAKASADLNRLRMAHEAEMHRLAIEEAGAKQIANAAEREAALDAIRAETDSSRELAKVEIEAANARAVATESRAAELHFASVQALHAQKAAQDEEANHKREIQRLEREAAEVALAELKT